MTLTLQTELSFLLILSAFLGMILGTNRERQNKDAGLRTHMLVALGATLFTIMGRYAFPGADTSRVAAAIVGGIGFLGAGVIYHTENKAKGLTTAASVWATAAVGLAVGAGAWFLSLVATLVMWFILEIMDKWKAEVFDS